MNKHCTKMLFVFLMLAVCSSFALAQVRIVGSISGTVQDPSGAVVPGAKVVLKDEGTGIQKDTVTNSQGGFLFPDLSHGTFEVTVTAQGFQTAVMSKIVVAASKTTDIVIKLSVGQLSTVVEVQGATTPTLTTSSNLVAATITTDAIQNLPVSGRDTLALARLTPGTATPQGSTDTHINGLPGGTINVTIDGINNASNGWKSGGTSFYGTVSARIGAVEEITVETGGLSADSGSMSGTNIKFVTKRGTNKYHGQLFYQGRNEALNANSWLRNAQNQARTKNRQNDFGGSIGGPLVPFYKPLKDKLFFFINYEDTYTPVTNTRSQTLLTSEAQQGIFRYQNTSGQIVTANLFSIAAANGATTTIDPIIASFLAKQNQAMTISGTYLRANTSTTDFRHTQVLYWDEDRTVNYYYPTTRVDYQITPKLAYTGTWNFRHSYDPGYTYWPLPENPRQSTYLVSGYFIWSQGLNWTINQRTFNEFRYGVQHSGDDMPGHGKYIYTINGKPMRIAPPGGTLSAMLLDTVPTTGRHFITTIYDTGTLIRGTHEFTIGGSYRRTDWNDHYGNGDSGLLGVPQYSLGYPSGDPVNSIFSATSLPGIQSGDISTAANLYAALTGRLSRVRQSMAVNPETKQYEGVEQGNNVWTRSHMGGFFGQDRWRAKQNLTINAGLRWELQGDPFDVNDISAFPDMANLFGPSTGLFKPGVLSGNNDPINKVGQHATKSRLNNFAPNLGIAWSPRFKEGILGKILGNGKTVLRASYSLVYYDEGTNMFAWSAGGNVGKLQLLSQTPGQGDAPYGMTLQSPLATFVGFPNTFVRDFHQSDFTFGSTFATMKPDLRTPYTQNWNFGLQFEVAKNMVFEARYVGNRATHGWKTYSLNEVNIFENGFLPEFINAKNNLDINVANGKGNTFINNSLPGQVALPIFSAAFGARGSMAALGNSSGWTSSGFVLNLNEGRAGALANSLATSSTYACRMFGNTFTPCTRIDSRYNAPGTYPINFFLTNPFSMGSLSYVDDDVFSTYNALQLNLRRTYARGFSFTANYTFAKNLGNTWASNANQAIDYQTLRHREWAKAPTPHDIRHTFNGYANYDLPVGKGRLLSLPSTLFNSKLASNMLDSLVGGWQLGGILSVQSGTPFKLSSGRATVNTNDSGVYLLNGLTEQDLQNMININPGTAGTNRYWLDPKLIDTATGRANTAYLGTPTTPGAWGQTIYLRSKNSFSLDASLVKNFRITESKRLSIWVGAFNVLNHANWLGGGGFLGSASVQSTSFGLMTGPSNSARSMQFRGVINF